MSARHAQVVPATGRCCHFPEAAHGPGWHYRQASNQQRLSGHSGDRSRQQRRGQYSGAAGGKLVLDDHSRATVWPLEWLLSVYIRSELTLKLVRPPCLLDDDHLGHLGQPLASSCSAFEGVERRAIWGRERALAALREIHRHWTIYPLPIYLSGMARCDATVKARPIRAPPHCMLTNCPPTMSQRR